jgi:hypothetical protein
MKVVIGGVKENVVIGVLVKHKTEIKYVSVRKCVDLL